jgi:hypothetical protein
MFGAFERFVLKAHSSLLYEEFLKEKIAHIVERNLFVRSPHCCFVTIEYVKTHYPGTVIRPLPNGFYANNTVTTFQRRSRQRRFEHSILST